MGNSKSKGGAPSSSSPSSSSAPSQDPSLSTADIDVSFSSDDDEVPSSSSRARSPSYYTLVKQGYAELVNAIIRPPRCTYSLSQLGPVTFVSNGVRYARTDFDLPTVRGSVLKCSHWEPTVRRSDAIPCLVYLHGNSSARVEAVGVLPCVLSLGLSCFAFDFSGSGHSDGDYVTLGVTEKEDLNCVVRHLCSTPYCSGVAMWGRSMGAATAIMQAARDASIACLVLDSPYSDLQTLALEMVDKGRERDRKSVV